MPSFFVRLAMQVIAVKTHKLITAFIAAIWIANGLFCKVLNWVPRHEMIVARILGGEHAIMLTKLIGMSEIAMAVWIISGIRSRWNAIAQIGIVASMNLLEFFLAPDLLLWGKGNAFFALLFILLIYFNEFKLAKGFKPTKDFKEHKISPQRP
ncbi:DoxX-like family protein [Flavitalea flava]